MQYNHNPYIPLKEIMINPLALHNLFFKDNLRQY